MNGIKKPAKPKDTLTIPGFKVLHSSIGKGASGNVLVCRNETDGSVLAVKLVRKTTTQEKGWCKREQKALRVYTRIKVKPDSLLDIRHVAISPDKEFLYYTMPLADGVGGVRPTSRKYAPLTLGHRIRKEKMLAYRECAEIAARTVEALKTLHANKMIHRDVKPDNIIFINGRAVLADMGLVTDKIADASMAGTDGYREPEEQPSFLNDLYGAGMVLYRMMSGNDTSEFPSQASRGEDKDSHLFTALNDVCFRACGDEEDRRYKDASEMIADLRKVLDTPEKAGPIVIDSKFAELVANGFNPGVPEHDEQFCPDGIGRHRTYKNDSGMITSIHWHFELGTFETHGGIHEEWKNHNWENSFLGYPVSDEHDFTDADYMRDILGKPHEVLPTSPRVIGRRSMFQGGCIVWFSESKLRVRVGDFLVFCRPVTGNNWRLVRTDATSSLPQNIGVLIPDIPDSVIPDTVPETDLDQAHAKKAWAAHQRLNGKRAMAKLSPKRNSESEPAPNLPVLAEKEPTKQNKMPDSLQRQPPHYVRDATPAWSKQQGPDTFSWEGCPGHLYKMTAPATFVKGQRDINTALSKVRVAIFLPENHKPDTPMVYALANVGEDYWLNSCLLRTVLGCGYGMVTMDMPLTGICKPGVDIISGASCLCNFNLLSTLAAITAIVANVGSQKVLKDSYSDSLRFITRNLWLTQQFLYDEFGLTPKRTVLTGVRHSVATAGYAFNATQFGDVLLGFIGVPEVLAGHMRSYSPPSAFDYLKTAFSIYTHLFSLLFGNNSSEMKPDAEFDPVAHAGRVMKPREVHLLCGNVDKECPTERVYGAIDRYPELENETTRRFTCNDRNRSHWQDSFEHSLSGSKSVTLFDGGADLSGWRGDLRLKFLETKLRMLNRRR
jgi:serine/threonine protein kinase